LHAQACHVGWHDTAGTHKYHDVRLGQMQHLAAVIKSEAADGEPVLLLGDFNVNARNSSELRSLQAEFADHLTGRSCFPMDVVATTFNGEHPATYGWKTDDGQLAEPFLTTKEANDIPESLDHVYYWPKECELDFNMIGTSAFKDGNLVTISNVRCNLELFPYKGPTNSRGKMPAHVSDHCGWSVCMELTWSHSAKVCSTWNPIDDESKCSPEPLKCAPAANPHSAPPAGGKNHTASDRKVHIVRSLAAQASMRVLPIVQSIAWRLGITCFFGQHAL